MPPRELMGLSSPWYFGAVPTEPNASARYASAFRQLHHPRGFGARWGPTTTERRACAYNFSNRAQCNWNAPVLQQQFKVMLACARPYGFGTAQSTEPDDAFFLLNLHQEIMDWRLGIAFQCIVRVTRALPI